MRHVPYKVQLHSNGRYWLARWYDEEGHRRSDSLGRKSNLTNIAAAQLCTGVERRIKLERLGGVPTIATLAARTFEGRHDLKPLTKTLYRETMAHFAAFAAAKRIGLGTSIDSITKQDASDFAAFLTDEREGYKRISPTTVHSHLRRMRGLYFMVADQLETFTYNPFARRKWKTPRVAQDWAEVDDRILKLLMDACPADEWRTMLAIARWAGLRKGECMRLRVRDVSLARRTLTVLPEEGVVSPSRLEGTKQRLRYVPISPKLAKVLAPAIRGRGPDELVCPGVKLLNFQRAWTGGPVGGRGSMKRRSRRYHGIFVRAKVAPFEKPMNTLRRNCGTEWAEHGIPITDVAKWMGNSVAVAAAYYVRTTPTTFARVTGLAKPLAKSGRVGYGKRANSPKNKVIRGRNSVVE